MNTNSGKISEEWEICKFVTEMEEESEKVCIGCYMVFVIIVAIVLWRLLC